MDEATQSSHTLRGFSQFLSTIDNGNLHADLGRELQKLIADMQDAAGGSLATKGKITLTLDLAFDPKNKTFEAAGDFTVKPPKERRGSSVLWSTAENFLTPLNPRQQDLFVRDVNSPGAVRTV